MSVVNMADHWKHVGRAHGEMFGAVRPAAAMVEVGALIDPAMLVEIQADAFILDRGNPAIGSANQPSAAG